MLIRSLLANTSLQTLTPFDALQRCTKFSEWLYPQRLTFDRVTWEPTPTPTPRSKLIPWYFLSILCAIWETSFVFILLQQLLSHKKDSEILMPTYVLLLSCCICYTLSTTICCAYHFNPEELCFVIRNMLRIKGLYKRCAICKCNFKKFPYSNLRTLQTMQTRNEYPVCKICWTVIH